MCKSQCFCFLFCLCIFGFSQLALAQSNGSLLDQKQRLKYQHDSLLVHKTADTLNISKDETLIYSRIWNKASKRKLSGKLVRFLIEPPDKIDDTGNEKGNERSDVPFIPYTGKAISKVHIITLDPFGTSVYDTTKIVTDGFSQWGNKMHFRTRAITISRDLFFKEGDKVNPQTIADSERLLNEQSYIHNAVINLNEDPLHPGMVEVWVIVRDRWSISFDLPLPNASDIKLGLEEKNFLGYGHLLDSRVVWDKDSDRRPWGMESKYRINNLYGSYISSEAGYKNLDDMERFSIQLEKPFLTSDIKWAGGFYYDATSEIKRLSLTDAEKYQRNYNTIDGWVGRSFAVDRNEILSGMRKNITVMLRVTDLNFNNRPGDNEFIKRFYSIQNKTAYMGSVSFTRQSFFASSMVYNFGRKEYITTGSSFNLMGGLEHNEFGDRIYLGLKHSTGLYLDRFGYLAPSLLMGSFHNRGKTEQGVFELETRYFTPLVTLGRYKMRTFLNLRYTRGYHTHEDECVTFNNDNYFSGFSSDSISGLRRFNVAYETSFFSPWRFHGFRFVPFIFAQMGWIGESGNSIFSNTMFTSLGMGMRIRNELLVFNTLQIRLSWFPNVPKDGARFDYLKFTNEQIYTPPSFRPEPPSIYKFR